MKKDISKDSKELISTENCNEETYMFPINGPVKANAYTKEIFEERTEKVFHVLWEILSKSFGPYGAPTIISQYPYYHVTKDGYTIFKNTNMDVSESIVDKVIAGMAMDICGRLNNTVGDGTTTAVISTYMIYNCYQKYKSYFNDNLILPRNTIKRFNELREIIIDKLKKESRQIQSDDPETLRKNIYQVAYISSNADEEISSMVANLYKELGCPKITPVLAADGITRSYVIDGYQIGVKLLDRLYINSDDNTANYKNLDVIMFDHKVTIDTYTYILKPLVYQCRQRDRHLLCIAPSYDTTALDGKIGSELNNEYKTSKDVSLVLASVFNSSSLSKLMLSDLAMLLNTRLITMSQERKMIEELDADPDNLFKIFDLDKRRIKGIKIAYVVKTSVDGRVTLGLTTYDGKDLDPSIYPYGELNEDYIPIGFVRDAACGLETSKFSGFEYDEKRYQDVLNDAEESLKKAIQKYSQLGTFNIEISNAQKRLHALKMKMGVIEVGGNSDLSQKLLKDAVDDTVKACASAYENGVILGCNVSLLRVINEVYSQYSLLNRKEDELSTILLSILNEGFRSVYKTVIENAFDDIMIPIDENNICDSFMMVANKYIHYESIADKTILEQAIWDSVNQTKESGRENEDYYCSLFDVIINYSIKANVVYDLDKFAFSTSIINSTETDKEVLIATSDLMSLLIAGNQLLINAYRE